MAGGSNGRAVYEVVITETLEKKVPCVASCREEAVKLVTDSYNEERIVLYADDIVRTSIR